MVEDMRVAVAHSFASRNRLGALVATAHRARAALGTDAVRLDVVEGNEVKDLLFVPGTRFGDRSAMVRFERVDAFVVDGEGAPWDPRNEALYHLVSQCIAYGKPFVGGPLAAAIVAYIRDTAGRPFPSLTAGTLDELRTILPQGTQNPL